MATTNENGQQRAGTVRTYRGRTLDELLPQIRSELGPDAIILREREGLLGGVGGFFAQRFIEVDARRGDGQSIDIYDDEPESDLRIGDRATDYDVIDRQTPAPLIDELALLPAAEPDPQVRVSRAAPLAEPPTREPQRFVPPRLEPPRAAPAPRVEPPVPRRFETDVFMERLREASAAWSDEDDLDELLPTSPGAGTTSAPVAAPVIDDAPVAEPEPYAPPATRSQPATPAPEPKPRRPARPGRAMSRADREAEQEAERAARAAAKREAREAARIERLAAREREKAAAQASADAASAAAATAERERAAATAERERAAATAEREQAAATAMAAAQAARAESAARARAAVPAAAAPTPATAPPPVSSAPTRSRPSSLRTDGHRPAPTPTAARPAPARPRVAVAPAVASGPPPAGAVVPFPATGSHEGVIGTLRGIVSARRRTLPRSATPKPLDAVTVAAVVNELATKGASEAFAAELISVAAVHGGILRGGLREAAEAEVARRIVPAPDLPTSGAAIAFIGAGGSGKTACTAALASAYRRASTLPVSVIALGSSDRGGELRQLLGREGVPIVAQNLERARQTVGRARDGGVVIVDTPAVNPNDAEAVQALGQTLEALGLDAVYVALPATLGSQAARRALASFGSLRPSALAITHADETDQLAVSLEIAISHRIPLAYLHAGTDHRSALSPVDPASIAQHLLP